MKLLWFHLMPYTRLPEGFAERHPSVWVDIDSRLFDPTLAHAWNGRFHKLRYVNVRPRPLQKPHREPAEYFYGRCLHVDARYAAPPGYTSEATLRARVQSQVAQAASRASGRGEAGRPRFEDIVEKGYVLIGSPDEVAERLREVATQLHVGHLMLLLQFGDMGRDLATYNTELFARRVMPQLAGLLEDEWEDHWWPQPLEASLRARPRELRPAP